MKFIELNKLKGQIGEFVTNAMRRIRFFFAFSAPLRENIFA